MATDHTRHPCSRPGCEASCKCGGLYEFARSGGPRIIENYKRTDPIPEHLLPEHMLPEHGRLVQDAIMPHRLERLVPRPQPANVVPLKTKTEPTVQDEILQMLDELAASIRSGQVSPSHLIMGWGEQTTVGGEPATTFVFDATGLTSFETIGHLYTYAARLASGDGQ